MDCESHRRVRGPAKLLPPGQRRILEAAETHIALTGRFPTLRWLVDQLGLFSTNGVRQSLIAMGGKGLLERDGSTWRIPNKMPMDRARDIEIKCQFLEKQNTELAKQCQEMEQKVQELKAQVEKFEKQDC